MTDESDTETDETSAFGKLVQRVSAILGADEEESDTEKKEGDESKAGEDATPVREESPNNPSRFDP